MKPGDWAYSRNEENWHLTFPTREEAIEEGLVAYGGPFFVGQIRKPIQPDELFDDDTVAQWIATACDHEDYTGECAEDALDTTNEQREDLAAAVRGVIASWLDRHKLRPTFFVVDSQTVEKIDGDTMRVRYVPKPGGLVRTIDVEDAEADPDNGTRSVCTPDQPMPAGNKGRWAHSRAKEIRDYGDTCRMRCETCGHEWTEELPQ